MAGVPKGTVTLSESPNPERNQGVSHTYHHTTKHKNGLESKFGLDENNPSPSSNDKSSDDRPKIPPVRDRDE